MKLNIVTIAMASIAITGVAAMPVLTENNIATLIPRDAGIDTAAALVPRAEAGVEGNVAIDYTRNDNSNGLGYVFPDDYFNGRYRRLRRLDRLRRWIMYWRGDTHACGYGTRNIGLC